MATMPFRRVFIVATLGVIALGAIGLAGWWHPNAPAATMQMYLPQITLPTVLVAALIDGINPCAFTVLLLFITALLTAAQSGHGSPLGAANALRIRLLGMGSIYIAAIFLTYLAIGVGVLKTADFFTRQHIPARAGALVAVLLGLWMLKDYFLPEGGWRLQAPRGVAIIAQRAAQKATIPALVVGGFFIGLCTIPCSGAVYLGILSLLSLQPSALLGYGYLVLYNVTFILPLVAILVMASARPALNRLARWNLHHKEGVRLAMGSGVILMGLLILATV